MCQEWPRLPRLGLGWWVVGVDPRHGAHEKAPVCFQEASGRLPPASQLLVNTAL